MSSKVNNGAASAAPGLSLRENEAIIERGIAAYREAGLALKRIRDDRQYKDTHKTFDAYCQERWGMGRQRAYELINAATTADDLYANGVQTPPQNERVARELKGTLAQKREAWNETVKRNGDKPTAEQTREVVEEKSPKVKIRSRTKQAQEEPSKSKHKPLKGKLAISHDPRVVEWVWDRYDEGWTRDRIVQASADNTDGWPLPDDVLTNGGVSEVRSAIRALERVGDNQPISQTANRKSTTGKVMREIRAEQKAGNDSVILDVRLNLVKMIAATEMIDLTDWADHLSKESEWEFSRIYTELITFQLWMDRTTSFVQGRLSDNNVREMIRHLREDQAGFNEHEVARRNEVAKRLERKLNNRLGD
jgi:hypothetical protein